MATGFGDLKVFSGSAHPQLTREIVRRLSNWVVQTDRERALSNR